MELRRKYASISAKVVWPLPSSIYLGYYALSLQSRINALRCFLINEGFFFFKCLISRVDSAHAGVWFLAYNLNRNSSYILLNSEDISIHVHTHTHKELK